MTTGMLLFALFVAVIGLDEPSIGGVRPVWVELHQSGTIEVDDQRVTIRQLAGRLRSASRDADILCVWREPKTLNGRPAFDIYDQASMKRFKEMLRVEASIVETADRLNLPVFTHRDAECQRVTGSATPSASATPLHSKQPAHGHNGNSGRPSYRDESK